MGWSRKMPRFKAKSYWKVLGVSLIYPPQWNVMNVFPPFSYVSPQGDGKMLPSGKCSLCKHNTEFGSHKQGIAGHTSNPNIGEVGTICWEQLSQKAWSYSTGVVLSALKFMNMSNNNTWFGKERKINLRDGYGRFCFSSVFFGQNDRSPAIQPSLAPFNPSILWWQAP